jgi:hypothetical protein
MRICTTNGEIADHYPAAALDLEVLASPRPIVLFVLRRSDSAPIGGREELGVVAFDRQVVSVDELHGSFDPVASTGGQADNGSVWYTGEIVIQLLGDIRLPRGVDFAQFAIAA